MAIAWKEAYRLLADDLDASRVDIEAVKDAQGAASRRPHGAMPTPERAFTCSPAGAAVTAYQKARRCRPGAQSHLAWRRRWPLHIPWERWMTMAPLQQYAASRAFPGAINPNLFPG